MKTYRAGDQVLIKYNPHRHDQDGVLGRVVEVARGAGFMGCDLFYVRYQASSGECEELPFGAVNLGDGSREELVAAALWHEQQATQLRALAETEPPVDPVGRQGSNP